MTCHFVMGYMPAGTSSMRTQSRHGGGGGTASCPHAADSHYLPLSRPNSVLKISSHPPPLCRSLGVENVQDDVARPFLFGWPGASDCDQGCCAASFFGRRARAGSKQGRAGICTERIGKIRQ